MSHASIAGAVCALLLTGLLSGCGEDATDPSGAGAASGTPESAQAPGGAGEYPVIGGNPGGGTPTGKPAQPEQGGMNPMANEKAPAPIPEVKAPAGGPHPGLLDPAKARATAPATCKVRFKTTKGDFMVQLDRSWAPIGVDRFYNLVRIGFFDDCYLYRAVPGFVVQWGVNGDPLVTKAWSGARMADDPVKQSNARGTVTFASAMRPGTRGTQVFINLTNNGSLDRSGFAPFGRVVAGMDVIESLNMSYGDKTLRYQGEMQNKGNAFIKKFFPDLDRIISAHVEP